MTEAEAKAMLDQYWEGSTRISSNTAMDLTEVGLRFLSHQPVHRKTHRHIHTHARTHLSLIHI